MSKKNVRESASTARVVLTGFTREQRVALTRERAKRIKEHPDFGANAFVQQTTASWEADADALEQISTRLANAQMEVASLRAQYEIRVASWKRSTKSVAASIDHTSQGSAVAIASWGFGVSARTIHAESSAAPTGLRATYREDFSILARWDAIKVNRGYLVQLGDANGENWQPPVPCAKAQFAPTGTSPGQRLAIRVAVLRKNGVSAWSAPLVVSAH